jgi:hypothetical protein
VDDRVESLAYLFFFDFPSTASLNVLSGRALRAAAILIGSPVCGLRPIRAARSTRANSANPVIKTGSPLATVVVRDRRVPPYEEAMKNSELPETKELAKKQQALSDGRPTFYNLDVIEVRDG